MTAMHSSTLKSLVTFLLLLFVDVRVVQTFEPVSTASAVTGAIVSLAVAGFNFLQCRIKECCSQPWIAANITGLQHDLATLLHGQHLVNDTIIRSIRGHLQNPNPSKALVLSFHGCTGCGKNFVSKIIANNLYKNGLKSDFVHLFISSYHFSHVDSVELYKDQLRQWVKRNISICAHSLFIFDEMDKMLPGVIEAIKPFIDHYAQIDGVDFRKSIFLFLSNNGDVAITERTKQHWEKGLVREDLELFDMEKLLTLHAYNEKGGLWHSGLVDRHLITAFIPFLPMERRHVKLCIVDDLRHKNQTVSDDIVNKVADRLPYHPPDAKLFASSGCKRVSQKVDLVLEDPSAEFLPVDLA